jgi:hypothetical protein
MLGEFGAMTSGVPCTVHSGLLPMIEAAAAQFQHDLPELLKDRRGQWVVYHGAKLVGFGGTKTDLLQACYSRGYPDDELYVARIQEDVDVSLEW